MAKEFEFEKVSELLKDYEYEIKLVQYYEQKDNPKFNNLLELTGTGTKIAFSGYIGLIKAFIATRQNNNEQLKELCNVIEDGLKYSSLRKELGAKVFTDLEQKGYTYCSYSSHEGRHANFIKFYKKDNEYFCNLYNAGAYIDKEQRKAATDRIIIKTSENDLSARYFTFPAITYKLKPEYGIEKAVNEIVSESALLTNSEISRRNKQRFFAPTISPSSKDIVHTQKSGNCTTRSIRELLRDNLPKSTFRELYDFITNTPYSEIMSELNQNQSIPLKPSTNNISLPIDLDGVMEIVKKQTKAGDKLLDSIAGLLKDDKGINKFLTSQEGIQFVVDILIRDISNPTRPCEHFLAGE